MDWFSFDDVTWLGVILATVSAFAVGMSWYSLKAFGTRWMGYIGKTEKQLRSAGGVLTYTLTIVTAFATALLLNILMGALAIGTPLDGAIFGAVVGLVFRLGTHVIHNGFAARPQGLMLIDGGHDIVALAAAGAIIGAFI